MAQDQYQWSKNGMLLMVGTWVMGFARYLLGASQVVVEMDRQCTREGHQEGGWLRLEGQSSPCL